MKLFFFGLLCYFVHLPVEAEVTPKVLKKIAIVTSGMAIVTQKMIIVAPMS